ncbi:MAG TPA: sigma-70 family RNA polymerase sigma factor [Bacteroidetes bacterium]|nr:sigma-70 family RNA polymerase sigma factor [Bacteroidota bacterium]
MDTDRELINKIIDGNQHAFRILVEDYRRLVSHIVYRMVADTSDREELAQEVFIKIYRNLAGYRFKSKLSTWIGKIAYNSCLNYLQKKKAPLYEDQIDRNDFQSKQKNISGAKDESLSPDQLLQNQQVKTLLREEISHLSVQQRTIITLFHFDEMSYKEIGEIMNLPAGTVKSHLFRARKRLKERLLAKYKTEEFFQ